MLILDRKDGEQIMIGDDIIVKIFRNKKSHAIRIGIEAPKEIKVYREEVYLKIKEKEEEEKNKK